MVKIRDSKGHLAWQGLIFSLVAYTAIEVPFNFVKHTGHELSSWQLILDTVITALFLGDIWHNFQLQNNSKREDQLLHIQGYHNYKKGPWLAIDIISSIPFDILAWSLGFNPVLFRLFRLLKIIRIVKLFTVMNSFSILPRSFKITSIAMTVFIAIHWVACGWISFGDTNLAGDFTTRYNLAFYWAVTTLTTIGYGDIIPTTNIGRVYTMVIMLLGVGLYGVVIASISKIIVSASRHKEKLKERLQDLHMLMRHYEVPRKVQSEVFSYYHSLTKQRLSDNDQKIVSELPHNLKQELEIYMVLKLVSSIPLFEGLSLRELKNVSKNLEQIFFSPGDIIIEKGDLGEEMFIISNGRVNIYNQEDQILNTLKSGQFFGEIALVMDIKRTANVRAKSYCDMYRLSKKSFDKLMKRHPTLKENIDKIIMKRSNDSSENKTTKKKAA